MKSEYLKIGGIALISSTVVGLVVYYATSSGSVPKAQPLSTPVSVEADANNDVVQPVKQTSQFDQPANTTNPNIETPSGPVTGIKFEKDVYDYGTIKQLSNNSYHFKFTNTGEVPLVISNAQGSCGCTVPSWPKEPIMPNETGQIEVVYTPKKGQLGKDEKTVTVTANIPTKTYTLKIKANVIE